MTKEEAYKTAIKACKSVWNEKTCRQIEEALKPKTGYWIKHSFSLACSECDFLIEFWKDGDYKYCPNCGIEMEEENECR